jgi:hypothetical protein
MEDKINQLIKLHTEELDRIMPIIGDNAEKYKNESEHED